MMFENQDHQRSSTEREEIISKLSVIKKPTGQLVKSRKVEAMISQLKSKPEINRISRQIAERRNQKVPIQDRYLLEMKRRERRLGKLKQQLENEQKSEERDLTFRPNINSRSRRLSRQRIDKNVGEGFFILLECIMRRFGVYSFEWILNWSNKRCDS